MESPLDILSRAAGMVSSSSSSPVPELRLKRKFDDAEEGPQGKKPLLDPPDDQPLDFSCKKKNTHSSEKDSSEAEGDPRRPSVIQKNYYATGPKFRRRFRDPSGSSSSSDSDAQPQIRRRRRHKLRRGVKGVGDERRIVVITSKSEDNIEEHFRRSLGDRYDSLKAEEEPPLSVDDHFKKALGQETWSRLSKADQQPPPR